MSYLKKSLISKIEVGRIITVKTASLWRYGYWSVYSENKYYILSVSKKEIVGKNVDYEHEHISISRRNLDDGYMIISL
jgi:hypothetical protein